MIVPQYWAEAKRRATLHGRRVTVRRFGWSDESQSDADRQAETRLQDAIERLERGERLAQREWKVPYNGAQGLPIREEILRRHGTTVETRNSYGAHCLNTPNVLFADIDFTPRHTPTPVLAWLVLLAGGIATALATRSAWALLAAFIVGTAVYAVITARARAHDQGHGERQLRGALRRIDAFLRAHPEWHVRLYRTPAGLRVLVTHRTFEPDEPAVHAFFREIGVDANYAAMCRNQRCFRARVTAKPWRIGIRAHMKPRPGVWPVAPNRLPERQRWIHLYEERAAHFAACRFLDARGSGGVHPEADHVRRVHDELARAHSSLPIA